MKIYDDILKTVGHTPLIRLTRFVKASGAKGEILAKAECFNPCGSVKDRVAVNMLEQAELEGKILEGGTVIEPTSGNTGIGLAMACAVKGYKLILTMPSSMSVERRKLLSALGAEVVLTDEKKGMSGAVEKADELLNKTPNSVIIGQFDNPFNPASHERTTAEEIIEDTEGRFDYFVSAVGTGGTLTGCGKTLKAKLPLVKIVAVEPSESPMLNKGVSGAHGIQGIGANFIPKTLDRSLIDEIIGVSTLKAKETARLLAKTEGFTCGISSGAALSAAIEILNEKPNSRIVVILPDGGDRYLSTDLFE